MNTKPELVAALAAGEADHVGDGLSFLMIEMNWPSFSFIAWKEML